MKANIKVDQQQQDLDDMVPVLHLHKFDDESEQELYGTMFMYEDEFMGLNVLPAFLRHLNLASIETVTKYTVNNQLNKPIRLDRYGLIKEEEWDDLLDKGIIFICREEAYYWDTVGEEFVKAGTLIKTAASRCVKIIADFSVCFGQGRIFLEEQAELQLKELYQHSNNDGSKISMLVLVARNKECFRC